MDFVAPHHGISQRRSRPQTEAPTVDQAIHLKRLRRDEARPRPLQGAASPAEKEHRVPVRGGRIH